MCNKVPAEGAAPLEGGLFSVNIRSPELCAPAKSAIVASPREGCQANHGQRASRTGGSAVRVCQLPSGARYFSPATVRAIASHPAVSE